MDERDQVILDKAIEFLAPELGKTSQAVAIRFIIRKFVAAKEQEQEQK